MGTEPELKQRLQNCGDARKMGCLPRRGKNTWNWPGGAVTFIVSSSVLEAGLLKAREAQRATPVILDVMHGVGG